jgi:glyoxylase-like metal-dependent hydrolase (beta-lactamase superfamily II)
MAIPLEDNFNDIIGKAQRGLKISDGELAEKSGVRIDALQRLRAGEFDESPARKVAPVLGLNADALVASGEKSWRPQALELAGVAQFNTPWDDMTVNSYIVWDAASGEAAAFDTGADCLPMLDFLSVKKITLKLIFLTHTHGDHIFDLDRLKEKTGAHAFVGSREPLDGAESFDVGREFALGDLKIETRLTWGHSKGGITCVVRGLARPVAVVGDALFAGSMGGGMVSYADALRTNRGEIFTLPDETVVCPGHGPLTTVGEERGHNPFFAK